jgi:hypothetical protein
MTSAAKIDDTLQSRDTLELMMETWQAALDDGHDPDLLANAALFTALTGLVSSYGEEAVVALAKSLPRRIREGEFTARHALQ